MSTLRKRLESVEERVEFQRHMDLERQFKGRSHLEMSFFSVTACIGRLVQAAGLALDSELPSQRAGNLGEAAPDPRPAIGDRARRPVGEARSPNVSAVSPLGRRHSSADDARAGAASSAERRSFTPMQ